MKFQIIWEEKHMTIVEEIQKLKQEKKGKTQLPSPTDPPLSPAPRSAPAHSAARAARLQNI